MEIFGKGISGTVKKSLHKTIAQRSFLKNYVKACKPSVEQARPELRNFYRFQGDYFSAFSNFAPWASLGCSAKMCPDFHFRKAWFKVLTEKFNLSSQMLPLAPFSASDRGIIAYASFEHEKRTAKAFFRNAYNKYLSSPLIGYSYLKTPAGDVVMRSWLSRPDKNNGYVFVMPSSSELEQATTFFFGLGVPSASNKVCKLLFTFGKVLSPGLLLRSYSDVNFNFHF